MSKAEEPAFPVDFQLSQKGLSKREYFAAMAMQGIIASGNHTNIRVIATNSLEVADELLKQLNSDADFAASLKA